MEWYAPQRVELQENQSLSRRRVRALETAEPEQEQHADERARVGHEGVSEEDSHQEGFEGAQVSIVAVVRMRRS
jgi:hypothetical protein